MANNKFIMIGIDDEKSKDIAEILGNKTCKKIIDYLADIKEASENDIAKSLTIPINTIEYNLNKLIRAGIVEKTKNFFWSIKGRKIDMYRLANKQIIITTKSIVKGFVPALLALLMGSLGIKLFFDKSSDISPDNYSRLMDIAQNAPGSEAVEKVSSAGVSQFSAISNICSNTGIEAWAWFLLGGLFVILIFFLWNEFKKLKGGF